MVDNGWSEYQKLVMSKLESCEERLTALEKTTSAIRVDLANFKGRIYGIATVLAAVVSLGVSAVSRLL